MKKHNSLTTAQEKKSITTQDLIEIYKSVERAQPSGRLLKEIYCGDIKSFNLWLGKFIKHTEQDGTLFHGVIVEEKTYMPRGMALLIDKTGEIFGVFSYDIAQ